jgi:hypothetical protein
MKRFDKAIKGLVKGYMNDTLVKKSCAACAVGNIIAECNKYTIDLFFSSFYSWKDKEGNSVGIQWDNVFLTGENKQLIYEGGYKGEAKEQIDSTGYTWEELAQVEFTFEKTQGNMFTKLMAVVEVLCNIEGFNDEIIKETKELFVLN